MRTAFLLAYLIHCWANAETFFFETENPIWGQLSSAAAVLATIYLWWLLLAPFPIIPEPVTYVWPERIV
jgi:hypothetical protein